MTKLLVAFPPFHPPTSPPFGIAALKGALSRSRPDTQVVLADWNLAFFRHWIFERPDHLCAYHPDRSLGQICPSTLVEHGRGAAIWGELCKLPTDEPGAMRYMQAAQRFDAIYATLSSYVRGWLKPFVEQRCRLDEPVVQALFGDALRTIEKEEPDLLGLSILAEQNLLWALALARLAKERYQVNVALGGAMISHLDAAEMLGAFPWVDALFTGEGETSLAAFVDVLEGRGDLESVPGLVHRGADGKPCAHEHGPPPVLNGLPPADFGDLPLADYLAHEIVLPMATSRGCYWGKCTFCSHTRPYAAGVRTRQASAVVEDMASQAERYGARSFLLVDEAISPHTLRELSEGLLERGLDLRWGAEGVRVEKRFDAELLATARRAGLRWLYVGIESASPRLLDLIDKGIEPEAVERFIAACHEARVVPQLSFIVGIPGTTSEELEAEIEFMRRHPVDGSPFVLLLGSPMQTEPDRLGITVEDRHRLFETPAGVVHAPRFHHTTRTGLSPQQADHQVETALADGRPRMRPHLGEVHAITLADTGFFDSEERPSPEPPPAEVARRLLEAQARTRPWWALHMAGCLEATEDLQEAYDLVEQALRDEPTDQEAAALWLHMAAIYNRGGRSDLVQAMSETVDLVAAAGSAARSELMRCSAMTGDVPAAIEYAEEMLATGYEFAGAWELLGEMLEQTGDLERARAAYQQAEVRDWPNAELNDAQARCFAARKKHRHVRKQEDKAARKRTFFLSPED